MFILGGRNRNLWCWLYSCWKWVVHSNYQEAQESLGLHRASWIPDSSSGNTLQSAICKLFHIFSLLVILTKIWYILKSICFCVDRKFSQCLSWRAVTRVNKKSASLESWKGPLVLSSMYSDPFHGIQVAPWQRANRLWNTRQKEMVYQQPVRITSLSLF